MKEIDLQKRCIDAVREMGGFAQKMSNRFLVGVPDLLIQLPEKNTTFWEVKRRGSVYQNPDPRPKQKIWLRDFVKAGGVGGVVYFVTQVNELAFVVRLARDFNLGNIIEPWRVEAHEYLPLPRGCKMQPFKDELMKAYDRCM